MKDSRMTLKKNHENCRIGKSSMNFYFTGKADPKVLAGKHLYCRRTTKSNYNVLSWYLM